MNPRQKWRGSSLCFSPQIWYTFNKLLGGKLSTNIYDTAELELEDGTIIFIKPLPIKQLKKFMLVIRELDSEDISTEEEAMDIFVKAAMVCIEKAYPEIGLNRESFEDIVNIPNMMKILEICGGLKLNDPNLLGAALVGTN